MVSPIKYVRKNFSNLEDALTLDSLLDIQKQSYDMFLGRNSKSKSSGLYKIFNNIFPITSSVIPKNKEIEIVFLDYYVGKYLDGVGNCKESGQTLSVPIVIYLSIYVKNYKKGSKQEKRQLLNRTHLMDTLLDIGNVPLITNRGTFIINGVEKTIINQLQRSPGIYYLKSDPLKSPDIVQLIPNTGSWLQVECDRYNNSYICLNKRVYIPLLTFLYALELNKYLILKTLFNPIRYTKTDKGSFRLNFDIDSIKSKVITRDLKDCSNSKVLIKAHTSVNDTLYNKVIESNLRTYEINLKNLNTFIDRGYKIVFIENIIKTTIKVMTRDLLNSYKSLDHLKEILLIPNAQINSNYRLKFFEDLMNTEELNPDRAKLLVYKLIEPNISSVGNKEKYFFEHSFFNLNYYDLSDFGRLNFHLKFGKKNKGNSLNRDDLLDLILHFFRLKDGLLNELESDFNLLPNRKLRTTGHILENLYESSLSTIKLNITQKLSNYNVIGEDKVNKSKMLNLFDFNYLKTNIQNFFNSSSLSQFVDQVNPLSELTHKRRITFLGSDGLGIESTTFQNRDVNITYYGRLCPIETPEGHNVGLVNTLSIYTKVNKLGILKTPYQQIENGILNSKINYISSLLEPYYKIGQSNEVRNNYDSFHSQYLYSRYNLHLMNLHKDSLNYLDVSTKQTLSISSSLIPFLEHNDASRALMGANMQRQAVPLMFTEPPLVGTGMEELVSRDSEYNIISDFNGKIAYVDNKYIVLVSDTPINTDINIKISSMEELQDYLGEHIQVYQLSKFTRSNQNTTINYKPIINIGDIVKKGQIIAEGPSFKLNNLALGKNLLVAYMSFGGYSFEDSIVISDRLVKENVLTSLHIENFEVSENKNESEVELFTNEIPTINKKSLDKLDKDGIIKLGSYVNSGDLIVGKVKIPLDTSKTKNLDLQNVESLIDVLKDNLQNNQNLVDVSYRLPKGKQGHVININKYYKYDNKLMPINKDFKFNYNLISELFIEHYMYQSLFSLLSHYYNQQSLISEEVHIEESLVALNKKDWWLSFNSLRKSFSLDFDKLYKMNDSYKLFSKKKTETNLFHFLDKNISSLIQSKQSVSKVIKIQIAYKHHIKPGDKITGRYGNKGIVSQILPTEDMPYLEDGTSVDIVLNPIGISSRMNIGQILETHLGWASLNISKQLKLIVNNNDKDLIHQNSKSLLYSFYSSGKEQKTIEYYSNKNFDYLLKSFNKGLPVQTPSFDSPLSVQIDDLLNLANLSSLGQSSLRDGKTGEYFDRKVTIGKIYALKLTHFVDNKIHARSIGPYNLISKQPLVGKAQLGGQRFGEMEVWALQAYGAAYTLQEMLTIKSDSNAAKESLLHMITHDNTDFDTKIPQSFHLLIRELWSLGLFIDLL